jgi:ADP-ribose pyrophosphatase
VIHLFIATELTMVPPRLGADEVIDTVERVPLRAALEMIRSGEIRDAKTIAALYLAARRVGAA